VGESNILDALAAIRETVAEAEATKEPVCILSTDFKEAFDKIAHTYLYGVLEQYGFGACMIGNIRKLYEGAESVAQINGFLSQPVGMECTIRQGFPVRTLLFALCLDPLLRKVNAEIKACRTVQQRNKIVTVMYVDDVTFILQSTQEIQIVQEATRL
jgi:hypothetical protein